MALGWTLRAHALLMDLHATDVVGSSAYSRLDSCLLQWIVCAMPCCQARGRSGNCRRFLHYRLQTKPMKRFAAYKQGVGDPDQSLAGCGRIRNGHWRGFGAVTDFHRSLRGSTSAPRGSLPERPCRRHESLERSVEKSMGPGGDPSVPGHARRLRLGAIARSLGAEPSVCREEARSGVQNRSPRRRGPHRGAGTAEAHRF